MEFEIILAGHQIHGESQIDVVLNFINPETDYEETPGDNGLYGVNDGVFKVSTPEEVLKHLKDLVTFTKDEYKGEEYYESKMKGKTKQEIYLLSFEEGAKSEQDIKELKEFEKLIAEAISNSENYCLIDYEEVI